MRAYLLWLVLATLLPGIVGASLLFVHQYQKARAQFEKNTLQTVRALLHTVDSKLLRGQAIAQTLSTIDALKNEDFARAHLQAREALSLTGASMNAVLRDRRGQQLMNTEVDYGIPLPLDHSPQIDKVFATGKPSVADVFRGAVRREPTVSIDVPVLVRGQIAYVLSVGLRPDYFEDMLTPKSLPEGAVASIFDARGVIFGRNLNAARFIGLPVSDSLHQAVLRSHEGVLGTTSREGVDVLSFYSRSEPSGWGVAVGVPRSLLIQSLLEPLAVLLGGLALLFAIGLCLAWQIGGRLARSVSGLHAGAAALGKGEPAPPFLDAGVKETAEVAESIGTAARLLAERALALAAKDTELRESHVMARFGTWHWNLASGHIATSDSVPVIFGRAVPPFALQRGTLLTEESWLRVERLRQDLEREGGSGRLELEVNHADGRRIWIDWRCESIAGADGKVSALRGTLQDVTERVKAEEGLRQADQRKNEFLAMLAHELRNPLAPIASGAQLLGQERLDPTRVRQISAIIARQARHMAGLVDDLLDVSRVTRGLVALSRQRLDINEVLADAAEQVQESARRKGHRLEVRLLPEPAWVMGDRKRLVQVAGNLLHNAVKFTADGGHIEAELSAGADTVTLRVSDNGIGMAPDELERAFDMFVQGERTPDRALGGLGIGLALVRSLVQLHGGQVAVDSPGQGLGSSFTVTLPRSAERASQAQDAGADAAQEARRLKVMVVDDNQDAADVLSMYVAAHGHEVLVENASPVALERAPGFAPDVCLLDIGLPDIDGHELARRLRADPRTQRALLVAVTGYGQAQDRRASAAAGFDHHLVKPVDMASLGRILEQAATRGGAVSA